MTKSIDQPTKTDHFGLDFAAFTRIIDNLHDEIIVYDHNYRIVYINKACERHYGFRQEDMIGKSFSHFVKENNCWDCSVLPTVYKLKRAIKQEQKTLLGADIFTIATPLFDENGDVEFVPMNVRDESTKISSTACSISRIPRKIRLSASRAASFITVAR